MSYMTTALGRSVSVDDWKQFQGDGVLKFLRDYVHPANLVQISNAGPLGLHNVKEVCDYLKEQFLVESMFPIELPSIKDEADPIRVMASAFYYEITATGKRFVEACLDEQFHAADQIMHEAKMTKQTNETNVMIMKKIDEIRDQIDRNGIPGNLVAISKKLREEILRELKVPKKDWSRFQVSADVRVRPSNLLTIAERDELAAKR